MEEFLRNWGYLGIFIGLVGTGLGMPMPEELPVVMGGALAGGHPEVRWWIMLPVCIAGVLISDGFLYAIGRWYGPRLLEFGWIKRRVFPPERLAVIENNFQKYGVKLLLFARLTPGIRAPVFFTAGMTRLPFSRFLLADGIYAIPGVSALFFLGYWFADSMVDFVKEIEQFKSYFGIIVVIVVIAYFVYRAVRKPMVTGDPKEIPPLVERVTQTIGSATSKIMHPKSGLHATPPTERIPSPAAPTEVQRKPVTSTESVEEPRTPGESGSHHGRQ